MLGQETTTDPGLVVYHIWSLRMSGKADSAKFFLEEIINKEARIDAYYELARTNYHLLLSGEEISTDEIYTSLDNVLGSGTIKYRMILLAEEVYSFLGVKGIELDTGMLKQRIEKVIKWHEEIKPGDKKLIHLYMTLPKMFGGDIDKGKKLSMKYYGEDYQYYFINENNYEQYFNYWDERKKEDNKDRITNMKLGEIYLFRGDSKKALMCFNESKMTGGGDGPGNYFELFNILMYHAERDTSLKKDLYKLLKKSISKATLWTFLDKEGFLSTSNRKASGYYILSQIEFDYDKIKSEKHKTEALEIDPYHTIYWDYFPPSDVPYEVLPGYQIEWTKTLKDNGFLKRALIK